MLRDKGIPVSPTSFLRLQKALGMGLIQSLEDFYSVARSLLVKSERYFDIYDKTFAVAFHGVADVDPTEEELSELSMQEMQKMVSAMSKSADNLFHLLENLLFCHRDCPLIMFL